MKAQVILGAIITISGIAAITSFTVFKPPMNNSAAIATTQLTGMGASALQQAAKEGKFLFLIVYDKDDSKTQALKKSLRELAPKLKANWSAIDLGVSEEKAFIQKLRMLSPETPFVISFAPNGAITGCHKEISEKQFRASMVSQGFQKCLRALQDNRLVILCIQNKSTKLNEEALQGVYEFKSDNKYAPFSEIVIVDPSDPEEKSFLKRLLKDPNPKEALTVLLSPPSSIIASFKGATTKKDFIDAIQRAGTADAPGGAVPGEGGTR